MDWYTLTKLRSLEKKRRRERLMKIEEKFATKSFEEQMNERKLQQEKEHKQAKVNELLETIRAMQIIGVDTTQIKKQASTILKTLK